LWALGRNKTLKSRFYWIGGDMKRDELKIFYAGGLNENLDKKLTNLLKEFGYKRWASGMNLKTLIRDLAYDRS